MTATDAQTHWMSAKIPNDQFLLFAFDGVGESIERIAADLEERASAVADLRLRVQEVPGTLDHPYWVSAPVTADQIRIHRGVGDWDACLAHLAGRMADQLDTPRRPGESISTTRCPMRRARPGTPRWRSCAPRPAR